MRSVKGFYQEYGREINVFLRTGKLSEPPKITEDIPSELREFLQERALAVKDTNRAIVDSLEFLDKKFTSKTAERMTVYRDAPKSWLNTAKNGVLTDKAYCSVSLTPGASLEGIIGSDAVNNARYKIILPKGSPYVDMTYSSEREMLLPRDSKFRIVGDYVLELII